MAAHPDEPTVSIEDGSEVAPGAALGKLLGRAAPGLTADEQQAKADLRRELFGTGSQIQLGRYALGRRLAAGGSGVVYVAHDPELGRDVAIKFVRSGEANTQGLQSDLREEAQHLASLQHPNVVTIHDVGLYDESDLGVEPGTTLDVHGRGVYLVMELVEGDPLDTWCGRKERSWREVLDVLLQAGSGLAHAHRSGLTHRDFKPGNVLVDGTDRPRVLDFGLARRARAPSESVGGGGTIAGTPAYMAPEQHRGEQAGPAADQYGFAVTAYEALLGHRPFAGKTLAALRAAKETLQLQTTPATRRVPRSVRRVLERALRADPQQRWASMDALLAALQRTSRRRWPWFIPATAIATGAALLAVAREPAEDPCDATRETDAIWGAEVRRSVHDAIAETGTIYADASWRRVESLMGQRVESWHRVHAQTCRAIEDVGDEPDPVAFLQLGCLQLRLAELRAFSQALAEGDADAVMQAPRALAGLPRATDCLDQDAVRREMVGRATTTGGARSLELRAALRGASTKSKLGRHAQALEKSEQIEDEARQSGDLVLMAEAELTHGLISSRAGRYPAAEASLERAVLTAERAGHDRARAEAAIKLVYLLGSRLGRAEDSARWARLAGAVVDRVDDPDLRASLATDHGAALMHAGQPGPALDLQRSALSILTERYGPNHPSVLHVRNRVGTNLAELGRWADAAREHRAILELREASLGPHHPALAQSLNNLGTALQGMERYEEAAPLHRRALDLREQSLGPDHPRTASAAFRLGRALSKLGEQDEATRLHLRALDIYSRTLGADSQWAAEVRESLEAIQGTKALPSPETKNPGKDRGPPATPPG